ncbi:hypothetical protein [Leptolyngbya sp. FACHB-711]|uniref:hypothetical protein n=1 Tax=Leptolyngbya sp. FACHB-711 TaxID=2692813 RepID=UPI0016859109|nr:hypothetical protein [Leptolyngbya sp. FACHB-711]MBD2025271.1 hypothetical protein [Leptolyngbya sp. FACHB-711]
MGKQSNPMIGCRVSSEWKAKIESIATASGRNSSQVIYEAIGVYLGCNDANTVGGQVASLESRLSEVERKLAGLTLLLGK